MKQIITTLAFTLATLLAQAQWSLDSCITYAQEHSFDVRRAIISLRNAEINHSSARVSMTPSVNAGISQDFTFGMAQGVDNIKYTRNQSSTSFNASVQMPVFTGLRITNSIRRTKTDVEAATANIESLRENIKVNVTAYYLNALYCKEMTTVNEYQLKLRKELLSRTNTLVEAGRQPESERYEVEAQVAQDSSALTDAQINYRTAIVDLCQLLNWPDVETFQITPLADTDADKILLETAEEVFAYSRQHHPAMKAARLQMQSARYAIREAQADYYPQLSLNASWGTGYYHVFNGNNPGFGQQFADNGSEMVGVSLSIPIYNRMQVRNNVKLQRNALTQATIDLAEQESRLYKEIQSAYYNALSAQEKYRSALASYKASESALEYALSKYELGRMSAYEYNEVQTRRSRAAAELSQAKFDFVLRHNILLLYAEPK